MSTMHNGITLLGLGPGSPDLLTLRAWNVLRQASEIYLRTSHHPTIAGFPNHLTVHNFDDLYQDSQSFEEVYSGIVNRVLELAHRPHGIIYAVPGHPFIAEATSPEIAKLARQEGIPVRIVEGLSFIEPVCSALGIDPFPQLSMVDALDIARSHVPSFPPDAPVLIAQMYSREVAADVKLTLMESYPDNHQVRLVHSAGTTEEKIEGIPLYELDRSQNIGLLSALYVPALAPQTSFESFHEVIAHLRAPEGCPWDREQTHLSLRPYLLEETYEVLAALDAEDMQALKEELGDLLLQIVLHAQIASEDGEFRISDVLANVNSKLVYRHPHVFGNVKVENVDNVLSNWDQLKSAEKKNNGETQASILDGVPLALPALIQADQYQRRAARTGFEWPDIRNVIDKVIEELTEVQSASSLEEKTMEVGDLLFAVVNLARTYGIEPESALREANLRFRKRFEFLESKVLESGLALSDLSITKLLELWELAKQVRQGNE